MALSRLCSMNKLQKSPLFLGVGNQFLRMSTTKSYTERQAALGRPISPHVEIYAFPVAAISSIMIRVTGCALSVGLGGLGVLGLAGADIPALTESFQTTVPALLPVAKYCVAFPLSYHYLGGIRHLVWDNIPDKLENKTVRDSSYGIIIGASVFSAVFSFYSTN